MQRIGQILPSLIINFGIEDAITLKFLRKKWKDIFSHPVTEYAFPKELKNGTLVVTVNSHVWLTQLKLLKDEFVKGLHPYGIEDVEFRFGRIQRNHRASKNEKHVILSTEQQSWMNHILKKIKDEEIKITTESLIKKYLIFINQFEQKANKN